MLINTYYRMGNEIIVLDDANVRWPVSNMIDRFGEETDDAREAVCVVVKLSENMWLPIHLSNLEHRTVN